MDLSPWDLTGILAGLVALAIGLAVVAVTARRTASSRVSTAGSRVSTADSRVSTAASRARPGAADAGAPTLTRRRLLERGAVVAAGSAMVGVVASAISYLTDALGGPGNRTYTVGTLEAVRAAVGRKDSPFFYNPSAGFYVVAYPEADLERARAAYGGTELAGMEAGFVALDQTCTHLGCRVPYCRSSAWFECPCHGSRFNGVGELRRGPAPRGLDRYAVRVVDGKVVVDTSKKVVGPPPGVDTTHQDPAGPHCR